MKIQISVIEITVGLAFAFGCGAQPELAGETSNVAAAGLTFTSAPIVGAQSSRCVDINASSTADGTQAQLWDCNGGINQTWTYNDSSQLVVYGNKCLQALGGGTSNGTPVVIGGCAAQDFQQWSVNPDRTITNLRSGLCLDAEGARTPNGTKIILWPCGTGDNQKWAVPSGGATSQGPCDIYASGGTPCVAAHSTVRALFAAYTGNLYRVRRSSDNTSRDIGLLSPGGFASSATQDSFCAGTTCVITIVYDQSGRGNHLEYQGAGSSVGGQDDPAVATRELLTVSGHNVYSLFIQPGNSYWRDGSRTGIPTGAAPEGLYMVTSGTHVNAGCCFDYGNSETDRRADGPGAMDSINFGTECWFGGCIGTGPWVQADLEFGLYSGGSQAWNTNQRAFPSKYVTAMLKNNGTTMFALKGSNAQSGTLTTLWNGSLPGGYSPMRKQGAIVLGSGGDCCAAGRNQSLGTFYEGAIVSGYPTDATDNAIQNNIIAAQYGR